MCVDREQQNSYNKLEQNLVEDIKRAFETLGQCCVDATEMLRELSERNDILGVLIEEAKEIAILEQRRKYCKNYLELKQIDRRLNLLKFKQGKRRRDRKCP